MGKGLKSECLEEITASQSHWSYLVIGRNFFVMTFLFFNDFLLKEYMLIVERKENHSVSFGQGNSFNIPVNHSPSRLCGAVKH